MASTPTLSLQLHEHAHTDDSDHECETASTDAPCNLALKEAKEPQEEGICAIPEVDVHLTNEDAGRILDCQSDPSDPTSDHFVYEPLQRTAGCIRLIEVLPPHEDGIIRCMIKHTEIGHPSVPADYTCLSYTWGASNLTRWIRMNGRSMKVGLNLWDFLRATSAIREQHGDKSSPLELCSKPQIGNEEGRPWAWYCNMWIDALCINQTQDEEKNHQVQQMGRIYQSAREVIVWLGNDPSVTALFSWNEEEKPQPMRNSLHQHLDENSYWDRAWVVQEVLLARDVYFLSQEVMVSLERLKRITEEPGVKPRLELVELLNLATQYSDKETQPYSLHQNVEVFRHRKCQDLRDRIYSALSISHNGKDLKVKYNRSLVELARNTLQLNESGVCLSSVLMILQALQVESNVSDQEKCSLLVTIEPSNWYSLDGSTPCALCGENQDTFPERISLPTVKEIKVICLRCKHARWFPASSGIHTTGHKGHLYLIKGIESGCSSLEWHLFWTPFRGVVWRKLKKYKSISITKEGAFDGLSLSVGLACELKHCIDLENHMHADYEHALLQNRSMIQARWKAVLGVE